MKRRWSGLQAIRVAPVEESSSEVTSSSTLIMSPANSLASTDIGDVDLEFWDLDINHQNQARNLIIQNGYAMTGHTIANLTVAKSDTSSISGRTMAVAVECDFYSSGDCSIDILELFPLIARYRIS